MVNEHKKGVAIMLLAGVCWGTSGTLSRLAPQGTAPIALAWTRLFCGGLFTLCAALLLSKRTFSLKSPLILLSGVLTAANQICFFAAMDHLGVALGTMLVIGSSVIMAGILGCFTGERPSGLWWFAAAIGIIGSCFAAASSSGSSLSLDLPGLLFGLGGGLAYAGLGVTFKLMDSQGFSATWRNAVALSGGALLLLPLPLFVTPMRWLMSSAGVLSALSIGMVATAIPYCLFAAALSRISVGQAYTISLAEPLTAGLLGLFLLGESLSLWGALGMALQFSSMVLTGWEATRKGADEPPAKAEKRWQGSDNSYNTL